MNHLTQQVFKTPTFFLAFGFGAGLLPKAPGTWGTLAAIPLYLLIARLPLTIYFSIVFLLFIIGIYLCQTTAQSLRQHDHPGIVWDEIVGYCMTMTAIPLKIHWIILGFVLFRVFDIWKPQPIRFLDKKVPGGFGIMLDDGIAAIFAWLILQSLIWIFQS